VSIFVSSSSQHTTVYVMADNATVVSLVHSIQANCSSLLSNSTSSTPVPFNSLKLRPEEAVQLFRGYSVAYLLQGYNNTADFTYPPNQPDTPLPSNIDTEFVGCLNQTIGAAVPLVDGAVSLNRASYSGVTMGIVFVFWCLSSLVF
jgi:hypothetical protein